MMRFRFHIGTILIIVVFLAVGIAALREANDWWEAGVFSLAVLALLLSVLLAIHRTQRKRAFWVGFALFGCGYLALTVIPPIESRLLTSKVLAFLDSKIGRQQGVSFVVTGTNSGGWTSSDAAFPVQGLSPQGSWLADTNTGVLVNVNATVPAPAGAALLGTWNGTSEKFLQIGHSLLALAAALLGGWLSRSLARPDRPAVSEQPSSS
jgi:hypothetical protein